MFIQILKHCFPEKLVRHIVLFKKMTMHKARLYVVVGMLKIYNFLKIK